jgi:hypothetical protein
MIFKTYRHKITGEFAYVEVHERFHVYQRGEVIAYWVTTSIPKLFPESHTLQGYKQYLDDEHVKWEDKPMWEDYELVDVEVSIIR